MKDIAKDLQYFIERRKQLAHPKINNYKFVNKIPLIIDSKHWVSVIVFIW
jgi:hypothetical protein